MPIDYQNVSMVNFVRSQKVVPAGWLLSADGPEISLCKFSIENQWVYCACMHNKNKMADVVRLRK